jgi:short subunit fatty acids transporter
VTPPQARPHAAGVARGLAVGWLAWGVGIVFIALGVVEVAVRVLSSDPIDTQAVVYWFVALCGGGTLVLLGAFVISRPGWALAAVVIGCLMGMIATTWTVLLPVAALALVVLSILQVGKPDQPPS